ncbi:MAG: Unknown protein [uncultured Sulfurovum sp.]|uniref:Uncharacterized protein n=1 Tax=uncultured Sulfurovum sp. TaxID=269237 RepID=A0A6S6TX56_9BACT|nr:MAG: Unknown protein [uncultured Sulfurovum sp.]
MRIISKFSDYYDMGLVYGIDDKLRFKRETKRIDESLLALQFVTIHFSKNNRKYKFTIFLNLIVFCHRDYFFVQVVLSEVTRKNKKEIYKEIKSDYCYVMKEVDDCIASFYKPIKEIETENIEFSGWGNSNCYQYIEKHLNPKEISRVHLLEKYKVPYLFIGKYPNVDSRQIVLLPKLKDFKFSKAVEAMNAFQQVSMYLGERNSQKEEIVQIDDKYLAQGKGFNCYSFRKVPTKKKEKKC